MKRIKINAPGHFYFSFLPNQHYFFSILSTKLSQETWLLYCCRLNKKLLKRRRTIGADRLLPLRYISKRYFLFTFQLPVSGGLSLSQVSRKRKADHSSYLDSSSHGLKTTAHSKHTVGHHHGGSSGADGDYHLVQHEVLYSPLNNQVRKNLVHRLTAILPINTRN